VKFVRWLSRHQAVHAILRNYTIDKDNRDPISKYCYKGLVANSKTITVLGDILAKLVQLCLCLQRRNTVMEVHSLLCNKQRLRNCFRNTYKMRRKNIQWSDRVKERNHPFISKLCDHLDARFPEDEVKEWSAFDLEALNSDKEIDSLTKKYEAILPRPHGLAMNMPADFKYIMKQKFKQVSVTTFSNMVSSTTKNIQVLNVCATSQASRADFERGFN
uniref:Uncharacterized protein n=1 Tax=Ciona savignyi TaxID=51511 RepID=H2Z3D6_CIOSA